MGILEKHLKLQDELSEICGVYDIDKEMSLVVSCLAGIDELLEVVDSVKDRTKPWKRHSFSIEDSRIEAIDVYHFLLQIFNVLGMDEEKIDDLYRQKRLINFERVKEKIGENGGNS